VSLGQALKLAAGSGMIVAAGVVIALTRFGAWRETLESVFQGDALHMGRALVLAPPMAGLFIGSAFGLTPVRIIDTPLGRSSRWLAALLPGVLLLACLAMEVLLAVEQAPPHDTMDLVARAYLGLSLCLLSAGSGVAVGHFAHAVIVILERLLGSLGALIIRRWGGTGGAT
jgi:hypothetical protein